MILGEDKWFLGTYACTVTIYAGEKKGGPPCELFGRF